MPVSYVSTYIHTVFSTKNRESFIFPNIEKELYAYITKICEELDCPVIAIGGFSDHIHILSRLSKSMTIIKFVEQVKCHSSKWIKEKGKAFENFYWQDGYGCFSISKSQIPQQKNYILNQKEHHGKQGYEGEFRSFLAKHGLEFDAEHF